MRNSFLYLTLVLIASSAWAKTVPATHESLENLMVDTRDSFFKSSSRIKYLQHTQTKMQQKLARELKTTPDKLTRAFVEDQGRMNLLWAPGWIELQTEFYTTLHQETLHQRWLSKTKNKKVSAYGKNLADSMIYHLGKYSGVKEGRLYNRWNDISLTKEGKKKNYRIPYFIFGTNTTSLLAMDAHTPYEQLFPKEAQATLGNPSLSTFLKNAGSEDREDNQLLAEKIQLNHRIYIRAVANAAKTIASVHYLTGEFSLTQTESKVAAFIEGFCDGCGPKEKKDYIASAMTYVKKTKGTLSQEYSGSKQVVESFCFGLRNNLYIFDEPVKKEPIYPGYKEVYVAVQDNTRVDQSHLRTQMLMIKLEAIRKTIQEHDLGVLFLTSSLTVLTSDQQPRGTVLGCRPETLSQDMSAVKRAITEARNNVEKYISIINQKIKGSTLSLKKAQETLEYFTQTNISATSEAVMTFPQGIGHTIDSVLELDRDVRRRKRIDKVVAWGGTIIGVGLTITGIGAPEGVALLLTVAAMTKGAISGAYNLYRSQQEKEFHKEMMNAKRGLGNNFYLDGNMATHYNEYRSLRIAYILDFAGAILSFAKIHKMALSKTGGDISKSHTLLQKCMKTLKDTGKDVIEGELAEVVLNAAVH